MSKPTIVFVSGIWHTPECFDSTRELLSKKGFPSEAPRNPSVGPKIADKTFADDVDNLRGRLIALADEGKEIVVACHSYGGAVGGCAVENLGYTDRASKGKTGGVTMLVYMSALVSKQGWSMLDMMGGQMLPWLQIGEDGFVRPGSPEYYLYHDLPPDEQAKWVSKLEPSSALIYQALEDRAFIPEAQDMMAQNIKKEGDITVFYCDASHFPFLSMPEKVVECLEVAAKLGTEKIGAAVAGKLIPMGPDRDLGP